MIDTPLRDGGTDALLMLKPSAFILLFQLDKMTDHKYVTLYLGKICQHEITCNFWTTGNTNGMGLC